MFTKDKCVKMATSQPISETIRALRKAEGLTMKELAERTGLSESAISRWENGNRVPSSDKLVTIIQALNGDVFVIK